MLERVRDFGTRCSLEVEKPREGIESLFGAPDLLLFSRHYARHRGFRRRGPFLRAIPRRPGQALFCAWGRTGRGRSTKRAQCTTARRFRRPGWSTPSVRVTRSTPPASTARCGPHRRRHPARGLSARRQEMWAGGAGRPRAAGGIGARALPPGRAGRPGVAGTADAPVRRRDLACFVVRRGNCAFAYRNACPHTGAPLEWRAHQFLDAEGAFVQCALHRRAVHTGGRPLRARALRGGGAEPVPVTVRDGWLTWTVPAERTTSRGS